jgi:hypothetical protein
VRRSSCGDAAGGPVPRRQPIFDLIGCPHARPCEQSKKHG